MVARALDLEEAEDDGGAQEPKRCGYGLFRGCPLPRPHNRLKLGEETFPILLSDRSVLSPDFLQGFDTTTCLNVGTGSVQKPHHDTGKFYFCEGNLRAATCLAQQC